jgi:DNA-directed RNA polymerase specialized sigma24 family protein
MNRALPTVVAGDSDPHATEGQRGGGTLVEDAGTRESLKKIVASLVADPGLREDLVQEALVRMWQAERECPGRTRSWYLQNCRFCVQHRLALGRSVDSMKRCIAANRVPLEEPRDQNGPNEMSSVDELLETVSFHDLQSVLSRHLTQRERVVLDGLADGLRLREIALQFKLSYPTALKYRRRIAALVSKLAIPRPFTRPDRSAVRVRTGVGEQHKRQRRVAWAKAA